MDRDRRVLLVHFDFVDDVLPRGLWSCPGGGIAPGETVEEGLVRELEEELGLTVTDPGAPIWVKEAVFPMTHWDGQRDTYFLVVVDAFEPRPQFTEQELLAEHIDGSRWWRYDELLAAQQVYDAGDRDADGYVVFSPRVLGHLVRDIVERGRPASLLELNSL
jgi:8-oxo-dGTP diphosphatase